MKTVLEDLLPSKCHYVWSDGGTEYHNQIVKKYLKSKEITLYTTGHEVKSAIAERVIKTIKLRISKYFTQNQTHKWVHILQDVTYAYNNAYHRSIKMTPTQAIATPDADLWRQQYITRIRPLVIKHFKHQIGDQVKLSIMGHKFSREYDLKWTGEYFQIISRKFSQGIPMYKVKSYDNEEIIGSFYESELQKTSFTNDSVFHIEKVIKTRKRKGIPEGLVKWFLWPSKYNSWVTMDQIKSFSSS